MRRARYWRPQLPWTTRSQGSQPTGQIGLQVSNVFQAHGNADQAVTDTGRFTLLRRQAPVGRGAWVRDGGLAVTQVGGDGNQAGCIDKAPGALFAALDLETHHRAKTTLLALGQRVL